ncbi:MAG: DUF2752 domain-containing protein [Bacteroidia bacterium]|nr:DUF2752 domain-containing protein [Bacteroidia bacterium]
MKRFFFRPGVQKVWLIALLLTPGVLWVLPAAFFDDTGFSVCPSKVFFNLECFGCGMTRAVMHLHHLDLESALYYNPGVAVIYPALVILWGYWVWKALQRSGWMPARLLSRRMAP